MKNISKIIIFSLLGAFTVACNGDREVEINAFKESVTYNQAKGYYRGNYYGSGTANFQLWLYSDSKEEVGILIDGYATMPTNPYSFRLDAGTYYVTETEAVRTVFPSVDNLEGSYVFDERSRRHIGVLDGSFSVSSAPYSYTIETNFRGRDTDSGTNVNDILINFSGYIDFEDISLSIYNFVPSKYTAVGTPYPSVPSAPSSWTGEVTTGYVYYKVTNWANCKWPLWLDDKNEILTLDDRSSIGYEGFYDLYFTAAYNPTGSTWFSVPDYIVRYNKSNGTMYLGGTFEGHDVYVGVWGQHYFTREWVVYTDTQVKDAMLTLTPLYALTSKAVRDSIPAIRSKSLPNAGSERRTATQIRSTLQSSYPDLQEAAKVGESGNIVRQRNQRSRTADY